MIRILLAAIAGVSLGLATQVPAGYAFWGSWDFLNPFWLWGQDWISLLTYWAIAFLIYLPLLPVAFWVGRKIGEADL